MDTTIIGTDFNSEVVQPQEQKVIGSEEEYKQKLSDLSKKFSTIQKMAKNHKVVYKNSTDNSLLNLINERKYRKIASAYRATKNGALLANLSPCEEALVSLLNKPFKWIDDLEKINEVCVNAQQNINKLLTNSYFWQNLCEYVESLDESAKGMEDFLTKEDDFLLNKEFYLEYKEVLKLAIENEKLIHSLKKVISDQLKIRRRLIHYGEYSDDKYVIKKHELNSLDTRFNNYNLYFQEDFCIFSNYEKIFKKYRQDKFEENMQDNSYVEKLKKGLKDYQKNFDQLINYRPFFENDTLVASNELNKLAEKMMEKFSNHPLYKDIQTATETILNNRDRTPKERNANKTFDDKYGNGSYVQLPQGNSNTTPTPKEVQRNKRRERNSRRNSSSKRISKAIIIQVNQENANDVYLSNNIQKTPFNMRNQPNVTNNITSSYNIN